MLAGLETVIEGWLTADERRPRKQRHTAQRVFDRLVAEHGYAGSYSPPVQRLVKQFRAEHRSRAEGFLELQWPPGRRRSISVRGMAIIAGVRLVLHLLVVTFPFSNTRFVQAYRGETAECVCHGLRRIVEHAGFVPRVLVFDNATGVGRRAGGEGDRVQARSPRSRRTTGSPPGTAIRTRATRRATSRTRLGSCAAT